MLLGPVFHAELTRTSRRTRYYTLRALYGLALLLLVWSRYETLLVSGLNRRGDVMISEIARFALETFLIFSLLQLTILLILVPALFGGVIADEKERKTIHYLMTSRLSSGEIVLDKLLARMLHVAVFILIGLPVLSLLSLFGGIPWEYVAGVYGGTFSIVFFSAALATLVSTLARRVRQGVLIAYLLMIFWLVVPPIADPLCRFVYPNFYAWFGPINGWLLASNPVDLLFRNLLMRGGFPTRGATAVLDPLLWMVGLQTSAGLLFLVLAMLQLRPTFRRQETGSGRLTWFRPGPGHPRWWNRPACGTDAMLWKECQFTRTDVFTKLVVLPATILLTVAILLVSDMDEAFLDAVSELSHQGYWGRFDHRAVFNQVLRQVSPVYIGLWLLAVAGASASRLTVERDQDTWISLTSTPLTGGQILRGKMIGAVWGLRGFGGLLGLFWLVGLMTGAVHPLGLLLAVLVVAIFTWEVAALGCFASLTARSTSRALTWTILTLIVVNGGFLAVLWPFFTLLEPVFRWFVSPRFGPWGYLSLVCTPYLGSFALLSFDHVGALFGAPGSSFPPPIIDWVAIRFAAAVVLGHTLAAYFLTNHANRQFDAIVDRPR